jgi:hypothetical protein
MDTCAGAFGREHGKKPGCRVTYKVTDAARVELDDLGAQQLDGTLLMLVAPEDFQLKSAKHWFETQRSSRQERRCLLTRLP